MTMTMPPTTATPLLGIADEASAEFAGAVRSLLERYADREALRTAWDSPDGRIPGLWSRLAESGVPGLGVPEELGGLGLPLTAAGPLLVEVGRAALPEPVTTTLVAAEVLRLWGSEEAGEILAGIAAGSTTVGLGLGPGSLVVGVGWCDVLLLRDPAGSAMHLVPAKSVTVAPAPAADRGERLADVEWSPEAGTPVANVTADRAISLSAAVTAAELLGVGAALLDLGVAHALTRQQFGQPIGGFQAVKHQLAAVFAALSFAGPVVAEGLRSVTADSSTAARDSSHALFAAGRAARLAARTALQVHGAIGYTHEHDLHIWLNRTWSLTTVFGDLSWHRRRVAAAVLDDVAAEGKQR